MIDRAYEITIKSINEPSLDYAGAILKRWYENGIRTPEEAESNDLQEKPKQLKNARKGKKAAEAESFDPDEFMAAAMKRSYKEN